MSQPSWAESKKQLELWGNAIALEIPTVLLSTEAYTAGFVNTRLKKLAGIAIFLYVISFISV